MADAFATYAVGRNSSGTASYLVSPNDSTDLPNGTARQLQVGGGGTVKFTSSAGVTDTWNVAAGAMIPMAVTRVFAIGTTATDIHAIY